MNKVMVLSDGTTLISEIEEVTSELGEPDCKLISPFVVNHKDETLSPWLNGISAQEEFMISSDKILTLADAMPTYLNKYEDLTKE